jgi:zinc D-Ala-D-Ala dipeptidase
MDVLMADLAGLPVAECGEALCDLRTVAAIRLDPRLSDPHGHYAMLRCGLVDRLVTAQTLLPASLRFLVIEGYRPPSLQEQYFNAHLDRLRQRHPDWTPQHLRREASRYIAPPDAAPPDAAPHVAGRAVDLTLATTAGTELWLGTAVNDTDTEACHTAYPDLDDQARHHRATLAKALSAAGFVNYPAEWWHWSYGDRYWAHATGEATAIYGPMTLA